MKIGDARREPKISEWTQARGGGLDEGEMVERSNRVLLGWANYFRPGQIAPANAASDAHATGRLRPNESPVREEHTPGSTSGEPKRGQGGD